jgi:hypothetical protein
MECWKGTQDVMVEIREYVDELAEIDWITTKNLTENHV